MLLALNALVVLLVDCSMIPLKCSASVFIHTVDSSGRDHSLIIMFMAKSITIYMLVTSSETLLVWPRTSFHASAKPSKQVVQWHLDLPACENPCRQLLPTHPQFHVLEEQ